MSEIHLNDFDRSIYSIWVTILNETRRFCEWVEHVDINLNTWADAKSVHSSMAGHSTFEIAVATFFLNRTNVSGIITGGPIGGRKQTGKYLIDARFNKQELINRIERVAQYKNRITINCMDGIEFLKTENRMNKKTFIYIDPPYVKKGADLYMNSFKEKEHRKLQQTVTQLSKQWLISYDNTQFIMDLYSDYSMVSYTLSQCTSNRMGDEIIVYPPSVKTDISLSKLKNPIII